MKRSELMRGRYRGAPPRVWSTMTTASVHATFVARVVMRAIAHSELGPAATDVYVRGRRFVYAVLASGLHATIVWGVIDEAEAIAMTQAWAATAGARSHVSLFDASALRSVDGAAFEVVRQYLTAGQGADASGIRRQAIVCGENFGGAIVIGYFTRFPPPFEIQIFERRATALAWLGGFDEKVIEHLVAEVGGGVDELVASLRGWLDASPLEAVALDVAARQLGVTGRTLQRHLAAANTRFTDEVARAQVARAQRLMLDPDAKLGAIALEVGCASASTFSELFRRVTGETPSQWRRRHLA